LQDFSTVFFKSEWIMVEKIIKLRQFASRGVALELVGEKAMSARTVAAEAARLINQEAVDERRTSTIQRRMDVFCRFYESAR